MENEEIIIRFLANLWIETCLLITFGGFLYRQFGGEASLVASPAPVWTLSWQSFTLVFSSGLLINLLSPGTQSSTFRGIPSLLHLTNMPKPDQPASLRVIIIVMTSSYTLISSSSCILIHIHIHSYNTVSYSLVWKSIDGIWSETEDWNSVKILAQSTVYYPVYV